MVLSLSLPVVLLQQSYQQVIISERGEGVSEEARLRAAFFGEYEFVLHQAPRYNFICTVFYNQDQLLHTKSPLVPFVGRHEQFKVVEEVEGPERTLTIESLQDGVSVELIEIIPLDGREQPLDFWSLEVSANRRTIGYGHNLPPQALQIRISGLNVVDVESVNACVWSGRKPGVQFARPIFGSFQCREPIRVDLLDNPRAEARGVEGHLKAVFGTIFGKDSGRNLWLACCYRYQLLDSGPEVRLPVLMIPTTNSKNLPFTVSAALKKWYQDVVPSREKGAFIFEITVFAANDDHRLPVLTLGELILPVESISELEW
jgi:hypothetical protein